MNAIKKARKYIENDPVSASSTILANLVRALESEVQFDLVLLYKLDFERFNVAIDILREWRLDGYYMGKAKLHDLSVQVSGLQREGASAD